MIKLQTQGLAPTTSGLATEEQLLIAAWAYGLKAGDNIHRFSLYAFIQSHLANKKEENLQKSLETNGQHWKGEGNGIYKLTNIAYKRISKYETPNFLIPVGSIFTFSRSIDHFIISVTVDPGKAKYIVKQNGETAKSKGIIEHIECLTADRIATSQTSLPRQIMNWVLRDNSYQWTSHSLKNYLV
jgi:organic radical activating enzyme